jgi:hypothetical protein
MTKHFGTVGITEVEHLSFVLDACKRVGGINFRPTDWIYRNCRHGLNCPCSVVLHLHILSLRLPLACSSKHQSGCPIPAARKAASSGPRPAQQLARLPSTTMAGTERMPNELARVATVGSFMSSTAISHDEHESRFTSSTVSLHTGHPALNISIFLLAMLFPPIFINRSFY